MVDESHEKMVEDLLKKTDDELIRWTCSGRQPEGYIAQTGRLIFEMRCASKSLKAATNMVKVTWAIQAAEKHLGFKFGHRWGGRALYSLIR